MPPGIRPCGQHAPATRTGEAARTAYAADGWFYPHRDEIVLDPPLPCVVPPALTDQHDATAWHAAERAVLLAIVEQAAVSGFPAYALRTALARSRSSIGRAAGTRRTPRCTMRATPPRRGHYGQRGILTDQLPKQARYPVGIHR
jgi:hypothetical protein